METQTLSIANAQSKSFKDFTRLLIWKFKPVQLSALLKAAYLKKTVAVLPRKVQVPIPIIAC